MNGYARRLEKMRQQLEEQDGPGRVVWIVGGEKGNYGYVETPHGNKRIESLSDVPPLTIGDVRTMPDSTLDDFHQLITTA